MNIKIGKKWIGKEKPVFVIAEGGINHNGNVKIAKKLVLKAKEAGADAIKFQTFKALDLASPKSKYFKLFEKLELDYSDFEEIAEYAKNQEITFLSTPFSENAVDFLNKIGMPAFKIASGDLTNIPLIKYIASKKKPMIISSGLANITEVKEAVKTIRSCKNNKIMIMHSVSSYPTPHSEANLKAILQLQKTFPYTIGYSDNGAENLVPVIAVAMGAKIIEKHFTINKKLSGPDHLLSADPSELNQIIKNIRLTESMLGDGIKKCQPSEKENLIAARRSITAKISIKKGTKISKEMLGIQRPATGIHPKNIDRIIGRIAKKNINEHESLKWEYLINRN